MRRPGPFAAARLRFGRAPAVALLFVLLASCGGRSGDRAIDIPSIEPQRIPIETLEPGPAVTVSSTTLPSTSPSPSPVPVPAPRVATIMSAAGTQKGAVGSYCWSDQVGGPSSCYSNDNPSQSTTLPARPAEKLLLRLDAQIPPDDESVRPFQGTRSGYPDQQIDPALETDLTVDLPAGTWSVDVCAAWHGRGQPICWLFKLKVGG